METNPTPPANPSAPVVAPAGAPAVAVAPAVANNMIQFEDFAKVELRIATVLECKAHPNADKLLVLQVDLGTEKRQICAGIKQHYAPEALVGKQVIIVANLAPRTLRGEVSHGMMLATTDMATGKVVFVTPSDAVAAGSKVS